MAKFNAGTAVESMEYDFTDYGGGSGVIPEPTDDILDAFYAQVAEVMGQVQETIGGLQNLDTTDPEAVQAALTQVEGSSIMSQVSSALTDVIAGLTQGRPSAEEIGRLPFRVKQAFMGWLVTQFSPEAATPGTNG